MKRTKLILLGTLLSQAAFAQTGGRHYLYSYDGAGNIISRLKATARNSQDADTDNDTANKNQQGDCQVYIKANESWSEVQIVIDGEIKQGDRLFIYTSTGIYVTSFRLESNKVTLNLSYLRKGTYMFRYSRNKKVTENKIVKSY